MPHHINTFIFLDLEATGLPGIGEKPRITELSMVATHRLALLDMAAAGYARKMPRVTDKLTLCVYPMKPVTPGAAAITGLYNDNLLHKKDFDENLAQTVKLFIERQEPPVCLVAHNGLGYDYPLLKAELQALGLRLPDGVLCSDSLPMLRELDAEKLAEEQRKQEEELMRHNQHTPVGPLRTMERTLSSGFESSGMPLESIRKVKRKLFDDDPVDSKTVLMNEEKSELGSDENHNQKKAPFSVDKVEVITLSESCSSDDSQELRMGNVVKAGNAATDSSQDSAASSPVICSIQNNVVDPDDVHTERRSQQSAADAVVYTSEEETTPAKQKNMLIQKLSCTETISEDSGSDMELGRMVLHNTNWSLTSLTDDMLLNIDLEAVADDYHKNELTSKQKASKKSESESDHFNTSGERSSGTDLNLHNTAERTALSCMRDEPPPKVSRVMEIIQSPPKPSTSKLEACRRNLQLQVAATAQQRTNTAYRNRASDRRPHTSTPSSRSNTTRAVSKSAVSYKLGDVYCRLFGSAPAESHSAEDDCVTLLLICQKTGVRMTEWCDENARLFESVQAMYEVKGRTPLKARVFPHH